MDDEMRDALINANTQSGRVPLETPGPVVQRLLEQGLIGRNYGLTTNGLIKRRRALEDRLDAAFGPVR